MLKRDYQVTLPVDGETVTVEMPAESPQLAARAALAAEPGASLVGARITSTLEIVAVCEVCGTPLFSEDDWQIRRGKVRCAFQCER